MVLVCACDNPTNRNETPIIVVDTLPILTNIPKDEYVDTVSYYTDEFPSDSGYINKILTTGSFHCNEVWAGVYKEKWFGLFHSHAGYYLSETSLDITRVHDMIKEETGIEKTAWSIKTVNKDTSILLVEGLGFLKPRMVQQITLPQNVINPGDTIFFSFSGIDYMLHAIGERKTRQSNYDYHGVYNYKLFLTTTRNGKEISEQLVSCGRFEDEMINIIFSGDIDGDGFLDLIIDISNHYNVKCPTLYLSIPSDNGQILKVVGAHKSFGC